MDPQLVLFTYFDSNTYAKNQTQQPIIYMYELYYRARKSQLSSISTDSLFSL